MIAIAIAIAGIVDVAVEGHVGDAFVVRVHDAGHDRFESWLTNTCHWPARDLDELEPVVRELQYPDGA
jgi:hypothetical protein